MHSSQSSGTHTPTGRHRDMQPRAPTPAGAPPTATALLGQAVIGALDQAQPPPTDIASAMQFLQHQLGSRVEGGSAKLATEIVSLWFKTRSFKTRASSHPTNGSPSASPTALQPSSASPSSGSPFPAPSAPPLPSPTPPVPIPPTSTQLKHIPTSSASHTVVPSSAQVLEPSRGSSSSSSAQRAVGTPASFSPAVSSAVTGANSSSNAIASSPSATADGVSTSGLPNVTATTTPKPPSPLSSSASATTPVSASGTLEDPNFGNSSPEAFPSGLSPSTPVTERPVSATSSSGGTNRSSRPPLAAIIAPILVFLLLVVVAAFFLVRRRKRRQASRAVSRASSFFSSSRPLFSPESIRPTSMASAWTTGTTMTELRSEDGLPWMSSPGFLSQYPPSPSQFPLLPGLNYPTIPSLSSSEPGIRHSSYLPSERIPQESAADPLPANPSIADPNPSANPSRDLSNVGALFEGTHTSLPPLPDFRFIDVRNRLSDQSSELASPGSAPREEVEVGLAF